MSIDIGKLSEAINRELTIYSKHITDGIKEETKNSMKQLVSKTKATAPVGKRHKHYKSNITSKKESETAMGVNYMWYVKGSDYRLSHLLNNGHAKKNGGRVEGTHFITKAHDEVIEKYEENVKKVIERG